MRTFSWTSSKIEVKDTKKYGKGVFAIKKIKKEEIIAIFGGYIKTIKEWEKLPKNFRDNGIQIKEDFVLVAPIKSDLEDASYFNHSCNPNTGFNGQIILVSIKDIRNEEQITFDYAMALHRPRKGDSYKFKCLCGARNCRKFITDNDWKIKRLQKKYKGYFQFYLQNKINKK